MIRRMQAKLILVSMLSLLLVLAVILGCVNALNYHSLVQEADAVLKLLAENDGRLPKFDEIRGEAYSSPEVPYEWRYFSVLLQDDGRVLAADTGQIAAVDQQSAVSFAQDVLQSQKARGFLGDYRYLAEQQEDGMRVSFLDCGRRLVTCRDFLLTSLWISLLGFAAVFLLVCLLSSRIIRPVADSYEKQKRFITDAGHEIKTPLAIIDADAELIAMDAGDSEWLRDIQSQVKRLTRLTGDLIYLARMEEADSPPEKLAFALSDLVEELAGSFRALALQQGKHFTSQVQPGISLRGDEKSIIQLVSILLDNAVKYADAGGEICISLDRQGHTVHLTVYNTAESIAQDDLPHLFDRFYRTDRSRNSRTGGYGLGLSIASAVVSAHKGKITATSKDGRSLTMAVTLPA